MSLWLLESVRFTLLIAVGGAAVLLAVGRNMEPRRRGRLWLAWLGLLVGAYALQRVVTTQREQVRLRLDRFIRCIRDKNAEGIADCIAADYASAEFDRRGFLDWIRGRLESFDIENTFVRRCDITITGDVAEMELTASAVVRYQGMSAGMPSGDWTLGWKNENNAWRITNITVKRINEKKVTSLHEIPQ